MKALCVLQPWAWAIIHGGKRIENRTWRTSYRGPLLIHAARSQRLFGRGLPLEPVGPERLFVPQAQLRSELPGLPPLEQLAFGAVIGVVELREVMPLESVHPGPFVEGPECWILAEPRAFARPVPCRGMPGLFEVPGLIQRTPDGSLELMWDIQAEAAAWAARQRRALARQEGLVPEA